MRALGLMVVVLASACVTTRDRGNADFEGRAATYKAPLEKRCDKYKAGGGRAAACAEAKYLAEIYVRRLSAPDEVCLEGGFGDQPTGACLARAAVVDSATNRALIEIRQAKPESKWFNHEQHQFWFEEGALVDLYLAEHGY